jgi:hypothetical protein
MAPHLFKIRQRFLGIFLSEIISFGPGYSKDFFEASINNLLPLNDSTQALVLFL